jgi:uncharacterized protein
MFIKRAITSTIKAGINQVPVLAIIGPRQSGKSTLAREIFKNYIYLDMQDASLFDFANNDPKGFLNNYKNDNGIIIDEAQYAPKLFSQIKVEADKDPRPGYFILSGSQNFLLHERISESLAGRAYFYKLLPLSIKELKDSHLLFDNPQEQIFKGFYPRVYQPTINEKDYYANYISTYVERDIRTIRNIENIISFKKFIQLCALRIGTLLNITALATDCNITTNTARSWLSLLEASFILFLLPSYQDNLRKRITKSPKLYFYDVGLASHLMGFSMKTITSDRSVYGALFENMIIVDLVKNFYAHNIPFNVSFFRDSNQNEVDLIIESGNRVLPIEIKATETIQSSFFKILHWFNQEIKNDEPPILIYGGNQNQIRTNSKVIAWHNTEYIAKELQI